MNRRKFIKGSILGILGGLFVKNIDAEEPIWDELPVEEKKKFLRPLYVFENCKQSLKTIPIIKVEETRGTKALTPLEFYEL